MVTIENYKVKPEAKIIDNIDIQVIYIPLESKLGYTYEPTVKVGAYVMIGSIIGKSNITELPLTSSVSGTVVGFENKYISNGKLVRCMVIENDFKEKYFNKPGRKKNINNYSVDEFLYILEKCSITDMGGTDYPLCLKYNTKEKIDYLIVDATDYQIYKSSDSIVVYNNPEEILESMDAIMDIMKITKGYIAVNEKNNSVIKKLLKHINTYPNIKIYPTIDAYPSGHPACLVSDIIGKNYHKSPEEIGVIYENVATVYAIYEALRYTEPLNSRIVTLSGPGFKKANNYKLKIGTNLNEILIKTDNYKKINNPIIIAGDAMTGIPIKSDDLIITKDLHTILILENKISKSSPCIKCGKCSEVCPVGLIPSLIIDTKNKKFNSQKCIECGLCSYVCPAKIEIREIIKKIKEDIHE